MEKERGTNKKRVAGFHVLENECIWMKAGVVNFRLCDNAYDCHRCPLDQGMRQAMGTGQQDVQEPREPAWVDYLRKRYDGASRPCRHTLTGHVAAPKICTLNYECYHCAFDQLLDEQDLAQPTAAVACEQVSGFRVAQGHYYHMGHSWARFDHGGRVRIGFDDFCVKLFGNVQRLDLPPLGAQVRQDEVGWAFGRNGHQAAALAPVTGRVLALNHRAVEHPEIVSHAPYDAGWLMILEPEMPKRNLKHLYFGQESHRWIEQESQALMQMMGPEYEALAASGGEAVGDIFGQFPELGWERLARTFLRTETVS